MNQNPISQKEFLQLLGSLSKDLDADAIAEFSNIEFGQWELPFEALLLELIKRDRDQISIDERLIAELAEGSDIVTDGGVIDFDSWTKYLQWNDKSGN